jgi:hypothetical protein
VQPWLAELSRDRSLANLVSVLEEGVEFAGGDPILLANLVAVFDSVSLAAQAVLEGHAKPISWNELLLGIGVDSGIHLVHPYRSVREENQRDASGSELLGTSTAQAVFFSALTTMASFGSLALSGHVGISSLGKVLLIGVTITLACNLIVLPALLSWRYARTEAG